MMTGFKLHEALNLGDIGDNDPKHGGSQLLSVLDGCHFVEFCVLKPAFFLQGWDRGNLSRHHSYVVAFWMPEYVRAMRPAWVSFINLESIEESQRDIVQRSDFEASDCFTLITAVQTFVPIFSSIFLQFQ